MVVRWTVRQIATPPRLFLSDYLHRLPNVQAPESRENKKYDGGSASDHATVPWQKLRHMFLRMPIQLLPQLNVV